MMNIYRLWSYHKFKRLELWNY